MKRRPFRATKTNARCQQSIGAEPLSMLLQLKMFTAYNEAMVDKSMTTKTTGKTSDKFMMYN